MFSSTILNVFLLPSSFSFSLFACLFLNKREKSAFYCMFNFLCVLVQLYLLHCVLICLFNCLFVAIVDLHCCIEKVFLFGMQLVIEFGRNDCVSFLRYIFGLIYRNTNFLQKTSSLHNSSNNLAIKLFSIYTHTVQMCERYGK